MTSINFDVVIVGGGVAGCATAIALQRFVPGLTVCVVDRQADNNDHDGNYTQHIRPRIGETLPPAVVVPMQQLGIWQQFTSSTASNTMAMASAGIQSTWGAQQPHINEHIYSPHGNGWHLNRQQFDNLLRDIAIEQNTHLIPQTRVTDIDRHNHQWRLTLSNAQSQSVRNQTESITAGFVVDATGRRAGIAQRLGINKQKFDRLIGIYRFYTAADRAAASTDSSTLIESHANGYWYAARLPNNQQVIALMTDADLVRTDDYGEASGFDQALASSRLISERVAGMRTNNKPIITAAHTQCLDKLSDSGWLAVGDAAFTYDPLSSLGIFKALRQGILASYAIKDFFSSKDSEVRKYQHVCRAEFNSYLDKRREVYAEESRFTHNPFWQRRLAA